MDIERFRTSGRRAVGGDLPVAGLTLGHDLAAGGASASSPVTGSGPSVASTVGHGAADAGAGPAGGRAVARQRRAHRGRCGLVVGAGAGATAALGVPGDQRTRRIMQAGVCVLRRWVDPDDVTLTGAYPWSSQAAGGAARGGDAGTRTSRSRRATRSIAASRRTRSRRTTSSSRSSATAAPGARRRCATSSSGRAIGRTADLERLGAKLLDRGRHHRLHGESEDPAVERAQPWSSTSAFEERKLAVELDGFRYHSSPESHAVDLSGRTT